MSQGQVQLNLKVQQITKPQLLRNDYIFKQQHIWKCINKSLLSFKDVDSGVTTSFNLQTYLKLETVQVVPSKWRVTNDPEGNMQVMLEARELGLGKQIAVEVLGFREFEELNIVNREAAKGVRIDYVVTLAYMKQPLQMYILDIEIK